MIAKWAIILGVVVLAFVLVHLIGRACDWQEERDRAAAEWNAFIRRGR